MNKKSIVIICIIGVLAIVAIFMMTGLNKGISNNKKLVEDKIKSKYGLTDFRIKTVRRSVYSTTIYKVVLKDGYEFDAYVVRECADCGVTPFGKYEANAYENYAEKYNSDIIAKYLSNKNYKFAIDTRLKNSEIPTYGIEVELDEKDFDRFLDDVKKLDSLGNGFIKTTSEYTSNVFTVKSNEKMVVFRVGDPSDTHNSIFFSEQLNKLK